MIKSREITEIEMEKAEFLKRLGMGNVESILVLQNTVFIKICKSEVEVSQNNPGCEGLKNG